jgi:RNA polymerase sigma-70 factor (ECF subfamily)
MPDSDDTNTYDLEIVSSVLQGNTAYFKKLVEKYQNTIYRLSRSYLGNIEEAEDATQEIFLRAFKSLSRFRLEKRFLTWLYTIAVNQLKTRYARLLRFNTRKRELDHEPVSLGNSPELITEQREVKREINRAVAGLPQTLKEIVLLYYFEEMNVTEIAEILDISQENVKSRLFRARKKLRMILEKSATGK